MKKKLILIFIPVFKLVSNFLNLREVIELPR